MGASTWVQLRPFNAPQNDAICHFLHRPAHFPSPGRRAPPKLWLWSSHGFHPYGEESVCTPSSRREIPKRPTPSKTEGMGHPQGREAFTSVMRKVWPPPFVILPLMSEPIQLWSHHEVTQWVRDHISDGTFKHCAHLTVIAVSRGRETVFVPNCKRRSFNWTTPPLDRQFELDILTSMLHTGVISCPANCVNYVSERRISLLRPLSKLQSVAWYLVVPFQWFAKLPWQTQVFLIILGILLVARPLIPLIVQLLKAYHGQ